MRAQPLRFTIFAICLPFTMVAAAIAPVGCHISTYECAEGATCYATEQPQGSLCADYCENLVECGDISSANETACREECNAAYAADPQGTEDACECATDAECDHEDECPPLPDPGPSTTNTTSGGEGGSGSGGNGGEGGSGGTPCEASCDCPEGLVCNDGTCGPAEPRPLPCENDCDCPSGETCTSGVCE